MSGKRIHLGAILGNALEPEIRVGRVVGIFRDDRPHRVVYRAFLPGDGDWPTGGYYSSFFNVEWDPVSS